jgi:hypothetical protein
LTYLSRENFLSLQWKRLTHKRSTTLFNPFLPFLIWNFLGDDMEREPLRPTDHFERRPLPYPLFGQQFVQTINACHSTLVSARIDARRRVFVAPLERSLK